jgi:integrase
MRVYLPTWKKPNGETRNARTWVIEFVDHTETRRRIMGLKDKRQTQALARQIERLVSMRVSGEPPDPATTRWLEGLPPDLLERLAEFSLLDSRRLAAGKPLEEHLDDWHRALSDKGCTPQHADLVAGRVRRVFSKCGFRHWPDISASRVQQFLADLRRGPKGKRGISVQTSNFYLGSAKGFCRWMVRERRAMENPLDHLDGLNIHVDRRHDRRALEVEELRRLLAAAADGPPRYGMTGPERAMLYRLAVETGLRRGELASLNSASFALDANPPTVCVAAAYSKHRREDVLPLRPGTAAAIRAYLSGRLDGEPAFNVPGHRLSAKMLKADLEAARENWLNEARTDGERAKRKESRFLAYVDASGRIADFHALRHTFITNLIRSGCHPKTAQILARHSTITLTLDRYCSRGVVGDEAAALDALPDLSGDPRRSEPATGTDG